MRNFFAFLFLALLGGCATVPASGIIPPTPAATAGQKICAVLSPAAQNISFALGNLQPPLDATDANNITKVTGDVKAYCANVAAITQASTQNLFDSAFPMILNIVEHSGMTSNGKNLVIISLTGVQTIAQIMYPTLVPVLVTPTTVPAVK